MTGFVDKVKNALQAEKNTPEAATANRGDNEYGHATHATGHGPGLHSGLVGEHNKSQLPGIERHEHLQHSHDPHNKLTGMNTTETDNVVEHGGLANHHGHHGPGTANNASSSSNTPAATGTTGTSSRLNDNNQTHPNLAHGNQAQDVGMTGSGAHSGLTEREKIATGTAIGSGGVTPLAEHGRHDYSKSHTSSTHTSPHDEKSHHGLGGLLHRHHNKDTVHKDQSASTHHDGTAAHHTSALHHDKNSSTPMASNDAATTTTSTSSPLPHGSTSHGALPHRTNAHDSGIGAGTGVAGAAGTGAMASAAHRHEDRHGEHNKSTPSNAGTGGYSSWTSESQGPGKNSGPPQTGTSFNTGTTGTSHTTVDPVANLQGAGSGHQGHNRDVGLVDGAVAGHGFEGASGSRSTGRTNAEPSSVQQSQSYALGSTTGSHHTGPHRNEILNSADPRVDSHGDASRSLGSTATTGNSEHYNSGNTRDGLASSNATTGHSLGSVPSSTNTAGASTGSNLETSSDNNKLHSSNMTNKLDPRVDSGSHASHGTTTTGTTGTTGSTDSTTNSMTHQTGHEYPTSTTSGTTTDTTGKTSSGTAGPHSSNLLNKLDPRVDSNLDGSRTVGNQTHTNNTHAGSDLHSSTSQGNTGTLGHTGNTGSSTTGHASGRPIDILHSGDHVTETAKRLDPNYH